MRKLKKIYIWCIIVLVVASLSSCEYGKNREKTLSIAVMGDPDTFYASYQDGITDAVSDLQKEYADTDYIFEVEFFNDESNYETGMKIVDRIVSDNHFTGVIGSRNMDISSSAAHIFDEHGKVYISPYYMYDGVCEDNYYDYIFSMCSSADNTGILLRKAAEQSSATKWAVCTTSREFEREELSGFVNYNGSNTEIIDCVSIDELSNDLNAVYDKWELLGVEGVAFFVNESDGFDILKKLKTKNPNLICAGDILFDDSERMETDAEFQAAMTNFIMADAFYIDYSDEDENNKLDKIADHYISEKGVEIDYWYLQGYNAVRMIFDTAVKNKTVNPKDIAESLHNDGYDGLMQKFEFDMRGIQTIVPDYYNVFTADGYWEEYLVR